VYWQRDVIISGGLFCNGKCNVDLLYLQIIKRAFYFIPAFF
jgi:hypothetical protein